jgi:hypothetical protein
MDHAPLKTLAPAAFDAAIDQANVTGPYTPWNALITPAPRRQGAALRRFDGVRQMAEAGAGITAKARNVVARRKIVGC